MNKTEKVTIKNVVYIRETTIDVFPFGWDCRALASALEVVWLENNEFKREIYMVDTRFGYDCPADEVELEWVGNVEEMQEKYKEYLIQQRCEESKKEGHSLFAKIGDTIEVYKGRKYPKGTRFVIKSESTYRDMYGRARAYYWITECGKKVDKFNCIIVG